MNILVFNCGSSSLKYSLIAMPAGEELAHGEAQRIGPVTAKPSRVVHYHAQQKQRLQVPMASHAAAFEEVMRLLESDSALHVDAIGHRLVHGGGIFNAHTMINKKVIADLEETADIALLHNPPAVCLIRACHKRFPDLPQAAIFDTVFHMTIPDHARAYMLPKALSAELGLRKYGFHGISHQYVTQQAAHILDIPLESLNAVSCHLGSGGASLCAVRNGCSVDNTMGYSPLQGLIMSTRCGDLDPAAPLQLLASAQGNWRAVEGFLNNQSGVLGMSGLSADIRDIFAACDKPGRSPAQLDSTEQSYLWRIRKYLGAYLAIAAPASTVIFTDTIGESVPLARWAVCTGMQEMGLHIDFAKNETPGPLPADISTEDSPVRILVIPTREELAIARSTFELANEQQYALIP